MLQQSLQAQGAIHTSICLFQIRHPFLTYFIEFLFIEINIILIVYYIFIFFIYKLKGFFLFFVVDFL